MRILSILLAVSLLAFPLFGDTLTNADILRLLQAGLSAETVQTKISNSSVQFDVSADALIELAKQSVPDGVVQAMITRQGQMTVEASAQKTQAAPPADRATASANATAPAANASSGKVSVEAAAAKARRYDVAIHRDENAKCDAGELKIDSRAVKGSRCKGLDFDLKWSDVKSVCYDYGFRGTIVFKSGSEEHRVSTTTPAEAKRIVDLIGEVQPALSKSEGGCN